MKKLTAQQIKSKYKGRYVDIYACPMWDINNKGERLYKVYKSYAEIHENTTLAEDVIE